MAKKNKLSTVLADPNVEAESGAPINTALPREEAIEENASALLRAMGTGEMNPETQVEIEKKTSALYKLLPIEMADNVVNNVRASFGATVDDINNYGSEALGLKADENGIPITPSQQAIRAINFDSFQRGLPREETDAKLEAAAQLDNEILVDTKRFSAVNEVMKKELSPKEKTTQEAPINMTVDDFYTAADEIDDQITSSDPNWEASVKQYNKMLNSAKVNVGEPAMERLGLTDYYPDINTPLQVGTYSGSIVGSNPIFVAGGGYVPFGVIDARKRALEGAAKDKAIKKQKIAEMAWAKGADQLQPQIDQMSIDLIDKFSKATGNDFSKLMDFDSELSMQWNKETHRMKTFGAQTIAIDKIATDLLEQGKNDKMYIPDAVLNTIYDWRAGTSNARQLYENPKEYARITNQLQSFHSMTYAVKQVMPQIQKDQRVMNLKTREMMELEGTTAEDIQEATKKIYSGNYDLIYSGMTKFVDMARLDEIVEGLFGDNNFYVGDRSKPESRDAAKLDMKKYIMSLISKEQTVKTQIANTGALFLNRLNRKDKEQDKKEAIMTTIHERAMAQKDNFVKIAQNPAERGVMADQMKQLYLSIGTTPILNKAGGFLNGIVRSNISLSHAAKGAKEQRLVDEMAIESPYDHKMYDYKSYRKHLETLYKGEGGKVDYNKMSDQDKYMYNLGSGSAVEMNKVQGTQQFHRYDANGQLKVLAETDSADDWTEALSTGTFVYGGNAQVDSPVYDKAGKQVYGVMITYEENGERKSMTVPDGTVKSAMASLKDKNPVELTRQPYLTKKTIKLPLMSRTIPYTDDIGVAGQNAEMITTSGQHKVAMEQEGNYIQEPPAEVEVESETIKL